MWEFISEHWPKGVFVAAMGITTWFTRREIHRNDEDHKEIERRLNSLEEAERNHVTHEDFDELRTSMMASMVNMSDRMEKNLNRMHDANSQTLDRIHTRVDDLWKNTHAGGAR